MIKTVISTLFTIYSLSSSNRRLLQTPAEPAAVEPAVPAIPPPPAVLEPVIPSSATPGVQSAPQPPPLPASAIPPGFQSTPTTPTTPSTGGGATTHSQNTMPWAQPQASGSSVKTECTITPPAAGSCAQQAITVSNPSNSWELQSNGLGAMYETQLTIDIPPTSQLEEIAGFWFTEPYSGYGIEITINNPTGRRIGIAGCECNEDYACSNMVIYTGPDVFFEAGDFFCDPSKIGSCDNCWIKENAMDVGLPCTSYI